MNSYCKTDGTNKCHGLLDGKEIECNDAPDCIKLLTIKTYFREFYLCFEYSRFIYIGNMYSYYNGLILPPLGSDRKTSFYINSTNETINSGDIITFTGTITYPQNNYLNYDDGINIIFNNTATSFVIQNINNTIGDCITPTTKFHLYMIDKDNNKSILGYREIDNTGAIKDIRPVTAEKVLPNEYFQPIQLTLKLAV